MTHPFMAGVAAELAQLSARKSRLMSNYERESDFGVPAGGAGSIWRPMLELPASRISPRFASDRHRQSGGPRR